ncbi:MULTISPECIES: hypothetical protein [unclassified Streptomyces]|uniref:hypothetical protein n=1 Tax=unclassified Streptomyces TaxID=2593676 RepID=UPI0037F6B746
METARAQVVGHTVRVALCVDGPDEIEAIGRALDVCQRLLAVTPELHRHLISDCRLL